MGIDDDNGAGPPAGPDDHPASRVMDKPSRDAELSLAEGVLRAAIRQGQTAFPVDPEFVADAIKELRDFRKSQPQ
jgi:hypothetical protein